MVGILIFVIFFGLPLNETVEVGSSWFALDIMSVGLVMLRVYLILLIYLSRTFIFNVGNYVKFYCLMIVGLLVRLVACFVSSRFLIFYLFFELRLIPTFFIIIGWGYQPERLQAGIYLILYTLFASLPLLFVLIKINVIIGSLGMWGYLASQWCLDFEH